ncbi:hypothetical protein PybrP1_007232 [[Pythium] brassicae (nom. inval.)]|nr:hypothetical protein PybrP1_007232 [[Pythium] brassicae (nom. inval.)]
MGLNVTKWSVHKQTPRIATWLQAADERAMRGDQDDQREDVRDQNLRGRSHPLHAHHDDHVGVEAGAELKIQNRGPRSAALHYRLGD